MLVASVLVLQAVTLLLIWLMMSRGFSSADADELEAALKAHINCRTASVDELQDDLRDLRNQISDYHNEVEAALAQLPKKRSKSAPAAQQ